MPGRAKREREQGFEDVSSYSPVEKKKRQKGYRGRTVLQCIAAFLCVVMILFGAALIYISTDLIAELTTNTITKDPAKLGIREDAVVDDSIKNIALFGLDSRSSDFRGQSDVTMILTVDNRHGAIKMTSILRDSLVNIEGENFSGEHVDWNSKINAAYAVGGPELAIRTLNQNYGLRIEDYVTVNFVNMAAIVDAFGGVEMEVTAEEIEEINLNLRNLYWEVEQQKQQDIAVGTYDELNYPIILDSDYMSATGDVATYLLNGNQAVSYGRIRNIGSDFGRVERQQKVLTGLVQRVKQLSITDYPSLIKNLMPYCETNLDLNDIMSMVPILATDMDMESISIPDPDFETDLQDIKYDLVYDLTQASKRMSAFIFEEGSPYWEEYQGATPAPDTGE
ncbi:MAG: LCP family protein [Acutalibacter sp.]|nr:LCP family protein [Acutalibacter sp.]